MFSTILTEKKYDTEDYSQIPDHQSKLISSQDNSKKSEKPSDFHEGSSTTCVRDSSSCDGNILGMSVSFRTPAPFSIEETALKTLKNCDYSIKISMEMARSGQAPRRVRVYADGIYDMFHSGHGRQLLQASSAFPNSYLIVGVCNDFETHRRKGRTVMSQAERYEALRHCRYVDEVLTDAPWSLDLEFIHKHKIDFVAHDDLPYQASGTQDVYQFLKDRGMFLATQRAEGISTSDVIGRIVRDYDIYLRRNIRRGLSRKELNISFVKEKRLQLQENIETMVRKGTNLFQNFGIKRREFIDQLEDLSHDVFQSFIKFFGSDGSLVNWLTDTRTAMTSAISPSSHSSNSDDHDELLSYSSSTEPSINGSHLNLPDSDSSNAKSVSEFGSTRCSSTLTQKRFIRRTSNTPSEDAIHSKRRRDD